MLAITPRGSFAVAAFAAALCYLASFRASPGGAVGDATLASIRGANNTLRIRVATNDTCEGYIASLGQGGFAVGALECGGYCIGQNQQGPPVTCIQCQNEVNGDVVQVVNQGGNYAPTNEQQCGKKSIGACYFDNNGNCACLKLVMAGVCQYNLDTGVLQNQQGGQ
jgi:hypothetical protein